MGDMYKRILTLCNRKGIKPGRICTDTGLSRGLITDLKMGRTKELSAKNTKIIADYFGVTTDYLLGTETEKAPIPKDEHERIDLKPSITNEQQSKESCPRPKIRSLARLESAELSENEDIEIANFIDYILSKKDKQ